MTTTSYTPSGQGGYLLPSGYLSTSGNQIIDANGNSVRIDSVGWAGADGAGGSLWGLTNTSYQNLMDSAKTDGFNTLRIAWSDVDLNAVPQPGNIDYSQNPDLQGLTNLQIFQKVVAYASQLGLKVIFDHHTDDGHGGQQPNGLWIDSGPGTDGTDGSGNSGTVDAAKFQQDWVQLASTFKGNSTVIGYDLDNEPTSVGNINWGQGGPTDIQAMYSTVGSAVEAADPGALIIAEGPQEYGGAPAGSGMNPNVVAPEGDLTGVATDPVRITVNGQAVTNKVVYSVHEYPYAVSGWQQDSGSAAISRMNAAWGYLETQNIAPVWIGEMGASLDGNNDGNSESVAGEQTWANTIIGYVNGQDGAQGGPTFSGNQQGIGTDWWALGEDAGQPDGIQSYLGAPGNYRAAQQAVTNQLVFVPKSGSSGTGGSSGSSKPSANDTVVKAGSSSAIVDASGNQWTITSGGQVAVNGTADTTTGNVIELAYVNGEVWQESASDLWWGKTSPTAAWSPAAGTATSPLPASAPKPSANDTVVKAGAAGTIIDASGNKWTITSGGQVAVNGTADTTTANVTELAYVNGEVWQENGSDLWWGKTSPTAAWSPAAGTATSPLPASTGSKASANDTVVKAGAAGTIVDASGNKWTITSAGQVAVNGTADTTTAKVIELAYVNGEVWQENASDLWWGKTSPTAAWSPAAGTSTSPLPAPTSTVAAAAADTALPLNNGSEFSGLILQDFTATLGAVLQQVSKPAGSVPPATASSSAGAVQGLDHPSHPTSMIGPSSLNGAGA